MSSPKEQKEELASCDKGPKDERVPLAAQGSYIADRKQHLEYLDLETEDTPKANTKPHCLTSLPTGTLPPSNVPVDPPELRADEDEHPPGEERVGGGSFDNEFSDMYSDASVPNLKRTSSEANFNDPENKYLTLDEIEERKRARMHGRTSGPFSQGPGMIRYSQANDFI